MARGGCWRSWESRAAEMTRFAGLLLAVTAFAAELRVGRSASEDSAIKALVLDDGETRAVLVVCDQAVLDDVTVKATRKQLAPSIAESNIMIAASGVRSSHAAATPGKIAEVVRHAIGAAQAASAWAGAGREEGTAFYNRFLMKDGNVRANPGRLNPDIVQPAGEADPDLLVAWFESATGQPLALFGSFSLQAGTLDYPGVIARTLSKLHGAELVTLWSTGAGANVTHVDVRSPAPPANGAGETRRVGTVLAGEAIKACARAARVSLPRLGVVREQVNLAPLKAGAPLIAVEVQVIALGSSLAWVALPGELWTELGAAIRKASPFPQTLLVGLANGSAGALPTRKGYAAGDLEPGVRAAAGSGEAVADAAVRLLAAARRLAIRQ